MSKKYLELIAAAFKRTKPVLDSRMTLQTEAQLEAATVQWNRDLLAIAVIAEDNNPQFKRGKFLATCGAL